MQPVRRRGLGMWSIWLSSTSFAYKYTAVAFHTTFWVPWQIGAPHSASWRFFIQKDNNETEYITFSEGITKTRWSRLHEKHRLTLPKMFARNSERCPINFQILSFKTNLGTFYLEFVTIYFWKYGIKRYQWE